MKTDITYLIKSDDKEILCIDEITDGGIMHHSNGVYFLMDNPNDEKIRVMEEFSRSEQCLQMIKFLKKDETLKFHLNKYDVELTVKDIHEGGLFKEN